MILGLVGKTNVGKSTFFKAATLAEVEIANRPFVTLKTSEGVAYVKVKCIDSDFNIKCNPKFGYCLKNYRFIPIKLLDVPGLIRGAHKGLGLGNKFLSDLIQADILIHIIDISGSTDEKGNEVEKLSYDPCNDVKFLEEEIDAWFFELIKEKWDLLVKHVKQNHEEFKKEIAKQFSGMKISEEYIEEAIKKINNKNLLAWNHKDLQLFIEELRKRSKHIIVAANKIDVEGSEKNLARLKIEFPHLTVIPCSAESELALKEAAKHNLIDYIPGNNDFKITGKLSEKQEAALKFIKKHVLEKFSNTGIQQILNYVIFNILNYITIYPVANENKLTDIEGNILPDAFLLPKNSTALDLAYKIHTDIGNKFNSAIDAKTKKRLSKEHILNNNDVIKIITK